MLPALPGIQELLNVMRSEVSDYWYIHSDMLTQSGVRYENDFANSNNACSTVFPTSDGCQPMDNILTGEARHGTPTDLTVKSTNHSETQKTPPKPTYTVLTSKTNNKFASPRPNPDHMNTALHELSNLTTNLTSSSDTQKILTKSIYTVLPSNTINFSPVRPNPDLIISTGPNELPKFTINPQACNPTANSKFQKILPKPVYTVILSNTNVNFSPARPKPNSTSPMLYQLLKPNIASATCNPMASVTQISSPKPICVVPMLNTNANFSSAKPAEPHSTSYMLYQLLNSNIASTACDSVTTEAPIASSTPTSNTSCAIERQDHVLPAGPKSTTPISGLNFLPCDSSNPEIQQRSPQSVYTVPSTKCSENSSYSKRQKKSVIKPKKIRISRKPRSKQVKSCVPGCDGSLSDVKVELAREELWKLFYDQGNEMIVSKHGRPIFPTLDLKVSGLGPDEMYNIAVRFVCVDKYRYYFYTSLEMWKQTFEDRHKLPAEHSRCFKHPESPACGQVWNTKLLTFRELRLINRPTKAKNMVYTPTMRKHRVQVVVTMLRCSRCLAEHTRHIDIPLTEFIAVSSYYSLKVTQMKIAHNPMAKTRGVSSQRKRKNCDRKSPENIPTSQTKKQKTDSDPVSPASSLSETNPRPSPMLATPINASESSQVTMSNNETLSTITSTQLSTVADLDTSSILPSTSSSQLSTMSPSVPLSTLPSTSNSQLPIISSQATIISSTSTIKRATLISSSTTTYPQQAAVNAMLSQNMAPSEHCNTVYTCQTTKPTAHIQTDEDILEYIKIYLSPFQTSEKNEAFDSSVFDELFNIDYISDKLNNFDDFNFVLTNSAEY